MSVTLEPYLGPSAQPFSTLRPHAVSELLHASRKRNRLLMRGQLRTPAPSTALPVSSSPLIVAVKSGVIGAGSVIETFPRYCVAIDRGGAGLATAAMEQL
jgi:hypothetical protein